LCANERSQHGIEVVQQRSQESALLITFDESQKRAGKVRDPQGARV
jgi:hypothetical protein